MGCPSNRKQETGTEEHSNEMVVMAVGVEAVLLL